jgi:methyl-accepting chemotaxis protein
MSEIASTIASAVEVQGATTQEISRNVQQAAHGTLEVSSSIVLNGYSAWLHVHLITAKETE